MGYGGGSGSGSGGSYNTVGGGSAFGGSDEQEVPSYGQAPAGSIRFNTDSKKLEVYILGPIGFGTTPNGIWMEVDSWSPDLMTGGTRGLFFGGYGPSPAPSVIRQQIDFINVDSTGNAADFGDLTAANKDSSSVGSRTRGICGGGQIPGGRTNLIQFVTIASTGDATDFSGDLTRITRASATCNDATRGLFAGGDTPSGNVDTIDYITMSSTGVDAQDFGNLVAVNSTLSGMSISSSTRGVIAGNDSANNVIQFVTISTLGNAADFGDLNVGRRSPGGCSNSVRGLIGGGFASPSLKNEIEYITIATLGDAIDFGDLTQARWLLSSCSSPTRGVFAGGYQPSPAATFNVIDYVQIMSTGDAVDFGDLAPIGGSGTGVKRSNTGTSNGHGGL